MKLKKINLSNANRIFVVMFFAIAGFTLTFTALNQSYKLPTGYDTVYLIGNNIYSKTIQKDSLAAYKTLNVKSVIINKSKTLFHYNPIFLVWSMLIIIMFSIAFGAFPVFYWQLAQLKKIFNLKKSQVISRILYSFILIGLIILSQKAFKGYYSPLDIIGNFKILFNDNNILFLIPVFALVLEIPIISTILLIGYSADNVSYTIENKASIEKAVIDFEYLKQALRNALQVLAILVVFSVLTAGSLRESIKATLSTPGLDIFPVEMVYVYGLFFSLFLSIVYIPTFFYLKLIVDKLKEVIRSNQNSQNNEEMKWSERILGTISPDGSALDNLRIALTVLAPLITSFLPAQLHNFIK